MEEKKEIVIVGGGPIGLACGIAAKNAGLDYAILEKGALVNSLFNYPLNMTFFSTAERLEIGGIPFSCIKPKPGREEALEYYRKVVEKLNIQLFTAVHSIQHKEEGGFRIETNQATFVAKNVVIATGFFGKPYLMNVPGEGLPKVRHYYRDPNEFSFQKVLVVGGQNSAVDAALQTFRKGAEVTMVVRGSEIGERVKYWIRPDVVNRIEEGEINAYFESQVIKITEDSVVIDTPNGIKEIENDFVLAMTGYRPDNHFLEELGVQFTNDEKLQPFYHQQTMETNIPHLFLAGVICGGTETHKWIIENSKIHADMIVNCIVQRNKN